MQEETGLRVFYSCKGLKELRQRGEDLLDPPKFLKLTLGKILGLIEDTVWSNVTKRSTCLNVDSGLWYVPHFNSTSAIWWTLATLSSVVAVFGRLERLSSSKLVRPQLNSDIQNFTVANDGAELPYNRQIWDLVKKWSLCQSEILNIRLLGHRFLFNTTGSEVRRCMSTNIDVDIHTWILSACTASLAWTKTSTKKLVQNMVSNLTHQKVGTQLKNLLWTQIVPLEKGHH